MKGSISAAEMHKQYNNSVSAFRKQIADPALRMKFSREMDAFMRKSTLGLWAQDGGGITPRHVEYYNAIYVKGNQVPTVLFWELSAGAAAYAGFQPPAFFKQMRQLDRQTGSNLSRGFVDVMTLMLLLFAAVDDKVSEGEAGFVNACADSLGALCGEDGILAGKEPLNANEFITRRRAEKKAGSVETAEETAEEVLPDAPVAEPEVSLEELLTQLEELCGLEKVKADVKSLINLVKVRKLRQEHELPVPPMSLHLVFMGNPGTGKTTVARLLAKIYHAIGVLSKGQLVEVDRSGLVAGFVGQTAIKTSEVMERAVGGVLFIDEAYALANQDAPNDFGKEAIEVILKGMEDNRNDLIVIVAGYTELMGKFIHSNPGLESRFNKYLYFDDYTGAQLMEIFQTLCRKNGYTLDQETEEFVREMLQECYENRDENFGNARDVRNSFERAVSRQADRVAELETPDKDSLMAFGIIDFKEEETEVELEG